MIKTPDGIEVIKALEVGRRQRFTAEEKRQLVAEAAAPVSSVSLVARCHRLSRASCFAGRG
jgi:transposase-like protein